MEKRMNLQELNEFATTFNMDPAKLGFCGFHDLILLDLPEEHTLPDPDTWENNEAEEFSDKYGIYWMQEYDSWGFYT